MTRMLGLGLMVALAGFAAPLAEASHPTAMCLDIEPDQKGTHSNDGIYETLAAYPGQTDAGHPPEHEGCVTALMVSQDWGGTQIDFEVTGAGDPDRGDTPETPDLSCSIESGGNQCAVTPPAPTGNNIVAARQTIRAWIDADLNDATVEADRGEGFDDAAHSGDSPEPDTTDVAQWMWDDHTHTRAPPCDAGSCPLETKLTIHYDTVTKGFWGEVRADYFGCRAGRVVKLWKERPGPDRLDGKVTSSERGDWARFGHPDARGRFYATVNLKFAPIEASEPPARYECLRDRSKTIRL